MTATPPVNIKPEPKIYLNMAISAIGLVILTMILAPILYSQLSDAAQPTLIWVAMVIFAAAFILALISLIKTRRKALPVIAVLVSVVPFFSTLCCVSGVLGLVYGLDFLGGNNPVFAPKPRVEWNPDPNAIIAQAAHPIRHHQPSLSSAYTRNYIPEARLWGDGRIIWTTYSGSARMVWEGRLTPEQMTALLKQFVDAGFFGWNNNYFSLLPYDNPPSDYLTLNLLSAQKTVTVTMVEPPRAFRTLFDTLNNGAGAPKDLFKPARGTLMAIPTQSQSTPQNWDSENLNLDLSTAQKGIPVEGKALELAWKTVNIDPYFPPPVSLKGVTYTIFLLIPGLMY